MPKQEIVRVSGGGNYADYLSFRCYTDESDISKDKSPLTVEELADSCDGQLENDNIPEMVGAHRFLAVVLAKHVGKEKATEIIREIAEYGGVYGLAESGAKDLGVSEPWGDWSVPDAN